MFTEKEVSHFYTLGGLDRIGFLGKGLGYLRAAYSDEETQAMLVFSEWAKNQPGIGKTLVSSRFDEALNNIITFDDPRSKVTEKYIEFVSHLDTVPNGGNYDGVVGIISGVLAANHLMKEGMLPKGVGVRVRIFRGEESGTFKVPYIGSQLSYGLFGIEHLEKEFRGTILREAMRSQGVTDKYLESLHPTISKQEKESILCSIECHIEQGPVLESEKIDIGIVTSIRGATRVRFDFHGKESHSGTTPIKYRADANSALLRGGAAVDIFNTENTKKNGAIITPTLLAGGNAISTVSGKASLSYDIRANSTKELENILLAVEKILTQEALMQGVNLSHQVLSKVPPVETLDNLLQAAIQDSCLELGFSFKYLPSGAGHDSAVIAIEGIRTAMFFIPNTGESHNPTEMIRSENVAKAASVMVRTAQMYADAAMAK